MPRRQPYIEKNFAAILLVVAMALSGFGGLATFVGLSELKTRDLYRAEMTAQDLAASASLVVASSIDKIDVSLRTVVNAVERMGATSADVRDLLAQQYQLLIEAEGINVNDARGSLIVAAGKSASEKLNVGDRDHFITLSRGESSGLVISEPLISRITGGHILVFSRAYKNPDGSFGGTVAIPAQTILFRRVAAGNTLGPNDSIGLWSFGLSPIVRLPERDTAALSPEMRTHMTIRVLSANFRDTGPNGPRIVAINQVDNAPIYAVSAVSETDALAAWRDLRNAALAILAAFVGCVMLAARQLYRIWMRQRRHTLELSDSNAQLAKAAREIRTLDVALLAARDIGGFGTFSLDTDTGIWTPSPEQAAIFGLEDSDAHRTRADWHALLDPDDLAALRKKIVRHPYSTRTDFDEEYRIVRPNDGEIRWIHSIGRIEGGNLMIGAVKDITDEKLRRDRVEYLAHHDPLTHLPNRTLLADRMDQALAARHDDLLAVCYLDLDGFKLVNDTWGHDFGDTLLVEVARRLQLQARAGDTVARLGGDEFVMLLCGVADTIELDVVIQRILDTIAEPYEIGDTVAHLSASIGVSICRRDPTIEPDALIRQADQAMYSAKSGGRNRFTLYDPEHDRRIRDLLSHTSRMTQALANGEFRLYYQPRVDLRDGRVDGVEALLRWQHPEQGLLPPAAFLEGLEGSELAAPLNDWILRTALRQQQAWLAEGLELTVAVNVFGDQLQHPDFAAHLAQILAEFPDRPAKRLELEILETTAMQDMQLVAERLAECAQLGVDFALDDFGTGYSSLTYFRSLPVSLLKIDRSFVSDILVNRSDLALVRSVIALAHAFDRGVVAEGVETLAHGRPLQDFGCNLAQGFGIARPMPPEEIAAWAASWRMPTEWHEPHD